MRRFGRQFGGCGCAHHPRCCECHRHCGCEAGDSDSNGKRFVQCVSVDRQRKCKCQRFNHSFCFGDGQ